jgi:sensor histidine kinase YesM
MVNDLINKRRLYWSLQVGGWMFYAILQIATSYLASNTQSVSGRRIIFLIYEAVICLLLSHAYRGLMINRKWMTLNLAKLIPRVIVTVFFIGIIIYFLRIPVSVYLQLFREQIVGSVEIIASGIFYYAFIFFLWSVLYFVYNYFESYNKSLKLEASIKEIELSNLKSQLNPHFIFNALNSIRALVDENPTKSKQAINQLSNILRNSLVTEKRSLTSFDDEIKVVRDYLGLESIRFEERLRIAFDIDPESATFMVPPLMIQTLVENGIKHGISKLKEGGVVQVKTRVIEDQLKIHIRNSGRLQMTSRVNGRSGLGLENTKQRLKLLYGEDASFKIFTENDTFVVTEIIIPHLYS